MKGALIYLAVIICLTLAGAIEHNRHMADYDWSHAIVGDAARKPDNWFDVLIESDCAVVIWGGLTIALVGAVCVGDVRKELAK